LTARPESEREKKNGATQEGNKAIAAPGKTRGQRTKDSTDPLSRKDIYIYARVGGEKLSFISSSGLGGAGKVENTATESGP